MTGQDRQNLVRTVFAQLFGGTAVAASSAADELSPLLSGTVL